MGNADSQPESTSLDLDHSMKDESSSSLPEEVASTFKPSATAIGSGILLQIPADALHSIASFLSPAEWKAISSTSRASRAACQSVYTRVRLHGFRCATEVATAWVSLFFLKRDLFIILYLSELI
jgi:hypothetical protein